MVPKIYQQLVEHLPDNFYFYALDPQGYFTYVSPNLCQRLGWPEEAFKHHYAKLLTDHPLKQQAVKKTELALKGFAQKPYLVVVRHEDQSLRWLELTETPILNDQGEVIGVNGIAQDVTQRRVAEESSEALRHFYKTAAELALANNRLRLKDLDSGLTSCLRILGEYLNASRAYLFHNDLIARTWSNTHEWCAPDIPSVIHDLQDVPFELFPGLIERFHRGEALVLEKLDDLPTEMAATARPILADQGIRSVLMQPMQIEGELLGFIGFDDNLQEREFTDLEQALLRLAADNFAATLARYREYQRAAQARDELALDVIRRKAAEEQLRLSASVFTHAREGILITDADAYIIDVNQAFTQITGYSRDETLGRKAGFLKSGQHSEQFYQKMWQNLLDNGYWQGEIWNQHKDGRTYAELLTISAVGDSHGQVQHYVGLFSDITLQKRQEEQLQRIAHYDALTGLPNRVLLADRLQTAMRRTAREKSLLGVFYIDLDGFKAVNDAQGHQAGDYLLANLAERMQIILREMDTISRVGGDEFVAVITDLQTDTQAIQLAERLLQEITQTIDYHGHALSVSASIGVTFYPQTQELVAEQLLRQADQAMYQAKRDGKNRFNLFLDED